MKTNIYYLEQKTVIFLSSLLLSYKKRKKKNRKTEGVDYHVSFVCVCVRARLHAGAPPFIFQPLNRYLQNVE